VGCGITVALDLFSLFYKPTPTFHGSLGPRPSAAPWDDKFGVPYPGLSGALNQAIGLPTSSGCEFGTCGSGPLSFSAQDPNNSRSDGIGITVDLGITAFFTAASRTVGCAFVGAGRGTQSFFGVQPPTVANGPPGAGTALRTVNKAYKVGAPGMMVRLSKAGPVGRLVGDAIPGVGENLALAQAGLAVSDGVQAFTECAIK